MKLIIDSDSLLYKFSFANQKSVTWGNGTKSIIVDPPKKAIAELDSFIQDMKDGFETEDYTLYLTAGKNFRYTIDPLYKDNRKSLEKPALFNVLKEHLINNHPTIITERIEADDLCCIHMKQLKDDAILCHIDKDLNQAVGRHYNYNTGDEYYITEEQAKDFYYYQVLRGDPVDGIKGCPKIGEMKAKKIIDEIKEKELDYWTRIVEEYNKRGATELDAIKTAQLVYMLQQEDYELEINNFNPIFGQSGI